MSSIYKRIGNYVLVEKQGLFGLSGKEGEMLLPCEYDSIFHEGGGFIITKNSKSGYIKFREQTQPHSHDEAVRGYGVEQGCRCIRPYQKRREHGALHARI